MRSLLSFARIQTRRSRSSKIDLASVVANLDPQRDTLLQTIERRTLIGDRFSDVRRLGTDGGDGHFSLLLTALDRLTGDRVALKFFDPAHSRDQYRWECFQREPRILLKFKGCRDILQCLAPHDEFQVPFTHGPLTYNIPFAYYAVELASHDVSAAILSQKLDAIEKLIIFRAMCRSIQRIQRESVAHRDVKPSNFLIMPDGTVRLSDFGTARDLSDPSGPLIRRYDAPPGDLRYSAPEILGGLHDSDAAFALGADMYSLGAILFELFTATPLTFQVFDASTIADLRQSMTAVDPAARVATYNSFLPSFADGHPLPSTRVYGLIPKSVSSPVNNLYRALAAIDYRVRLRDFDRVFTQINTCLWILRHESTYRLWRVRRKLNRLARDTKHNRRGSEQGSALC